MDIWPWLCNLPTSDSWSESDPELVFQLATSKNNQDNTTQSILLKAERTSGSDIQVLVTFSISLHGFFFSTANGNKTLWISHPCSLSSPKPFLPIVLQILQELISRGPTTDPRTPPPPKLDPEVISQLLESESGSFSNFFRLIFLCRLFWLCVCEAPAQVGSVYFQTLAYNLDDVVVTSKPFMKRLLASIGGDGELYLMRSVGYMLAKWLIFRETGQQRMRSQKHVSDDRFLSFSHVVESHGLLVMKGYAPVLAIPRTGYDNQQQESICGLFEAKESVLRYALGHQQLEAVIQLDYSISLHWSFIEVALRVDNLRLQVVRLGLAEDEEDDNSDGYMEERHFPSRVRVWVGPENSIHVSGLSLGRSTDNPEREVETQRVVNGSFGSSKSPKVKATATNGLKARIRNWRWDQEALGNTAILEWVLCDNWSGAEVATWRLKNLKGRFRKRYSGACRAFSKTGGVVFAADEYGDWVRWRVGKEMEGKVLKWRFGAKVWLSYCSSHFKTSFCETRCVEWSEEIDLNLKVVGNES